MRTVRYNQLPLAMLLAPLVVLLLLASSSTFILSSAATPQCSTALLVTPDPAFGFWTASGPSASTTPQALVLFPPGSPPFGSPITSNLWLTNKQYWTSGFISTFDIEITMSGSSTAPPGLAFVIAGTNVGQTAHPSQIPGAAPEQLGFGYPRSIALEFDLFSDAATGDTTTPAVTLHSAYSGVNTANKSAQLTTTAIQTFPSFQLKTQNISVNIEYVAALSQITYCFKNSSAGNFTCAYVVVDKAQFNSAWNSNGNDGTAFIGFSSTATNNQYGGLRIFNFALATVQPHAPFSTVTGLMRTAGATFVVSTGSSQLPSGRLFTYDTCNTPLLTSSAPVIQMRPTWPVGTALDFQFSITDNYDGTYDLYIWSPICSIPNTPVALDFYVNSELIQSSSFSIVFNQGSLISVDYSETFATISPPPPSTPLYVGALLTQTISFMDSSSKPVPATLTMFVHHGWSDGALTQLAINGRMNYTWTVSTNVARSNMSYLFFLSTSTPISQSSQQRWKFDVTTPPPFDITLGQTPQAPLIVTSPAPNTAIDVALKLGSDIVAISPYFLIGRLYYVQTLHPTKPAPVANGQLMSTTVFSGSSAPSVVALRFFQPGTNASAIAGLYTFKISFGLDEKTSFNITNQPSSPPASVEVAPISPAYYSPQTNVTTTAHIFLKDFYGNYNYLTFGANLGIRLAGPNVGFTANCGNGNFLISKSYGLQCIYIQGRLDVTLGISDISAVGTKAAIQLVYLQTSNIGSAYEVSYAAPICPSCTIYGNMTGSVTANGYFQFDMMLQVDATTPFLPTLTNLSIVPATSADWQGLFNITRYSPTQGRYLVKGQIAAALYSYSKLTVLTPFFDGVAATPGVDVWIVPSTTPLCLNKTKYVNLPSSIQPGAPIIFDMSFFDCESNPYVPNSYDFFIEFVLNPILLLASPTIALPTGVSSSVHIVIRPAKLINSPAFQLQLTPSVSGFNGTLPIMPPITVNSSLPVCIQCTSYSSLPATVQQGTGLTFIIYLFNSTAGTPPLTSFPADFNITVDSNPSMHTTPTLTREGSVYRLTTQLIVNAITGGMNLQFNIRIYGFLAPTTPVIVITKSTHPQPVLCALCTTYLAADGIHPMPTSVPSGSTLNITFFLHDSGTTVLGHFLPTSNVTFLLPFDVAGSDVAFDNVNGYTVSFTFKELSPLDPPTPFIILPLFNGQSASNLTITVMPPVYCASCTVYAEHSIATIAAGGEFKLSVLLYATNGRALGSYLPVENVTIVGTEVVKSSAMIRTDIPIAQTNTSAKVVAVAAGMVKTSTGTASGYEITVTFNTPATTTATTVSLALNGVSINRPIPLTLNRAVLPPSPSDQPDPCVDIDPRITCPVQSEECVSTVVLLPERNGGKNYTYECRDILKIQRIVPTSAGTNVSTLITVTMQYDVPANFHISLNGHDIPLNLSTTDTRMFTFLMLPAAELNYSIPHNQTDGQRVNFSLSAHVGVYDYALVDVPSPGLTLFPTPCVDEGTYWIPATDACLPCPNNAYCPGGTDIYPLPGYYSTSDTDPAITKCLVSDACRGFSPSNVGLYQFDSASQCNTDAGYTGPLCSDCTSDHYKQEVVCRSCGLDDAAQKQFILVLVVALVIFAIMAAGVAFIQDEKLTIYIAIIVFIQQCSFVGSIGSSKLSSGPLAAFFQFISLLNFEVAYFKLGCTVPQITYVQVFWATILMMVVAALMLTVASGLFAYTRSDEYLRLKFASRGKIFARRMQNSMTILGVVVYLQLTTQFFKGLFCVEINGQHVLQVEPSTVCYEGGHLITAIFIWPLLFAYSCGFPILCFFLVMRTRSLNLWSSSAAKFVYLYRGLKIRFIYFKQFNFVTSFALALQITLSTTSNTTVRLAIAFLFFALNVFLVGVFWPYYKKFQNWLAIVAGLANALSGLLLLTVLSQQVNQDSSKLGDLEGIGLFFLGFGILACFVLFIFPARYLSQKYFPGKETTEDDELLQSGHYDELAASRTKKGLGTNPRIAKRQAQTRKSVEVDSSTAIELQKQRADSSPFDEPQKQSAATKHFDDDYSNNHADANDPTSPTAAATNNHNKSALPPLAPTSSFSPPPLSSPSDYPSPPMSPHSDLPIHDHSAAQSDELPTDVVVQSSDIELHQPIPSQPKFDADEYEREKEDGLL